MAAWQHRWRCPLCEIAHSADHVCCLGHVQSRPIFPIMRFRLHFDSTRLRKLERVSLGSVRDGTEGM